MMKRSVKMCAAVSPLISNSFVKTNVLPHITTTRIATIWGSHVDCERFMKAAALLSLTDFRLVDDNIYGIDNMPLTGFTTQ